MTHGTRWKYSKGCRCRPCRNARRDGGREERRRKGMQQIVSVDRSRARLNRLNAPNVAIARVTGLSIGFIAKIRSNFNKKFVYESTERLILSVTEEQIDESWLGSKFVNGKETRQLVLDLNASGFSNREIGRKLGIKSPLAFSRERVRLWNAKRIERMYRTAGVRAA